VIRLDGIILLNAEPKSMNSLLTCVINVGKDGVYSAVSMALSVLLIGRRWVQPAGGHQGLLQ
jgi:hypothetical protein